VEDVKKFCSIKDNVDHKRFLTTLVSKPAEGSSASVEEGSPSSALTLASGVRELTKEYYRLRVGHTKNACEKTGMRERVALDMYWEGGEVVSGKSLAKLQRRLAMQQLKSVTTKMVEDEKETKPGVEALMKKDPISPDEEKIKSEWRRFEQYVEMAEETQISLDFLTGAHIDDTRLKEDMPQFDRSLAMSFPLDRTPGGDLLGLSDLWIHLPFFPSRRALLLERYFLSTIRGSAGKLRKIWEKQRDTDPNSPL
ncbi:unnamed protein product, partial [Amoebophrya sp. A25]